MDTEDSSKKSVVSGSSSEKEGYKLLGEPTFKPLENGRFKCVETGHELPDHAKPTYSISKRCRIGLIDYALSHSKTPLNMFKQDPLNSSKLICKLTGDTVNKSEEHIWKHINGKRFFNKLEQLEAGKLQGKGEGEVDGKGENEEADRSIGKEDVKAEKRKDKKKKKKKKKKTNIEEIVSEIRDAPEDSDAEELDFWMPPVGERWDFDDGGDRWGSDSESGDLLDEEDEQGVENETESNVSSELSTRTKRMSVEIGPSSFASRKKKSKKESQ